MNPMTNHNRIDRAVDDTFDDSDEAVENAAVEMLSGTAQGQLKAFIERIERVEEDEAALKADKKEIYAEAKGSGFDVKIVRKVVRRRKVDAAKRQEEEALIDLYESAIN